MDVQNVEDLLQRLFEALPILPGLELFRLHDVPVNGWWHTKRLLCDALHESILDHNSQRSALAIDLWQLR